MNDPASTVLGQGHRSSLSLGVSGGSNTLTYAVTGSYQAELGLPKLPDYEAVRYQDRVGAAPPDWMTRPQHLTQWGINSQLRVRLGATADLSLSAAVTRTSQRRSSLEQQLGTLMSTYLDLASGLYYNQSNPDGLNYTGSLLTDYYEQATSMPTYFTNGVQLTWKPRSWLTVRADGGLNLDHRDDKIWLPHGVNPLDTAGTVNVGQGTSVVGTANLWSSVLAPLGFLGLTFRFAAGLNYTGTSTSDQNIQTSRLPPGTSLLGSVIDNAGRNVRDDATFGWYLEPAVGNQRINVDLGFRLDGGSSYGQSGLPRVTFPPKFPKLGFTYLVSDEPWFPLKDQVQSLRVRLAYGKAGRQPGVTDRLRLYGAQQAYWTDGGFATGEFLQTLGNTEVRPERTTEVEGGFDADLLDSRVTLSVTGYRKTTDDALLSFPLPPSVYGGGSILKNIGTIRNTGLEFTVAAQLLRSELVTWGTQLSMSRNRNIVVRLGDGVEPFYTGSNRICGFDRSSNCGGGIRVAPGYPLFGRWSTPIVGYADANGDGVLQANEITLGDTAVYVGQTIPNYTANLSTTVSLWRTVTVNAQFDYQDGLAQQNQVAHQLQPFSKGVNDPTASLAEQAASALLTQTDYNWIQVVNTFRFNSLAVAYRVPDRVAHWLRVQQLNVSLQGGNLGLWTNYRGIDPNVNARATGNEVTDTGVLPLPRTWQFRVNATY